MFHRENWESCNVLELGYKQPIQAVILTTKGEVTNVVVFSTWCVLLDAINGNDIYIAHFLYSISKCALQFNPGVKSDVSL